jgi:hypothetical protein
MRQFEDLETGRILSTEHETSAQLMKNNPQKYKEISVGKTKARSNSSKQEN